MLHDPITDFVSSLDLKGAIFLRAEFTAPWAIVAHVTEEDCQPFMPVPRQIIAYHIILEGEALINVGDSQGCRKFRKVRPGDILILPTNSLHTLASAPDVPAIPDGDIILPAGQDGLLRIEHGGGGDRMRMVCGFMASGAGPMPLLESLPELLIVNVESLETRNWIETSVAMAARELSAGRLSGSALVAGVARLLLIEALRALAEENSPPSGWLNGMAHPRISRALARIHTDLAAALRIDDLAVETGMSRSAFVERFTEVVGVGPRRYILSQRMEAASLLLDDPNLSISEIACQVGYDAPEAFSRAFKRERGLSPLDWRQGRRSVA